MNKSLVTLIVLVVFSLVAAAEIEVAHSATQADPATSSFTFPDFDLADGNALVVLVSGEGTNSPPVYSVTFGGIPLVEAVFANEGIQGAGIYYLVEPAFATGEVVVTLDGNTRAAATVLSLTRVQGVGGTAGAGEPDNFDLVYDGFAGALVVGAFADNSWKEGVSVVSGGNIDQFTHRIPGTQDGQSSGLIHGYGRIEADGTYTESFIEDPSSNRNAGVVAVFLPMVDSSRFLGDLAEQHGLLGEDVTFTAPAFVPTVGVEPVFQWEVSTDGGTNWSDIPNANASVHTVEAVRGADHGNLYRLRATAGNTVVTNAAALSVAYPPPQAVQGLEDAFVAEGEAFVFEVIAEGLGNLSYAWRKNGVLLSDVTGNTLTIDEMRGSDAGIYSVTITDDAAAADGLAFASVTLTAELHLDARLTHVKADFRAGPGANTFPAIAFAESPLQDDLWGLRTGFGTDDFIWQASGNEGGEDAPEISTVIDGLVPGGEYFVWVNFYEIPESAGSQHWNLRGGFESGNLTLFANGDDDGSAVLEAEPAYLANRYAYTNPPKFDDGGNRLLLGGFLGSRIADANGEIAVYVDDLPASGTNDRSWYDGVSYLKAEEIRFMRRLENRVAEIGDDVTFEAPEFLIARGVEATFQWEVSTDDGATWEPIAGAAETSLAIRDVQRSDHGNQYRLRATTTGETTTSEAILSVNYPAPRIVEAIHSMTLREGDSFAFEVTAEGVGNLTYEWTLNGETVAEVDGNVFDLGTVDPGDAGTYAVTVTDDAAVAEGLEATSVTLAATVWTLAAPAPERAISLNFVGTSSGAELGLIRFDEPAGVLPVVNWNSSAAVTGIASSPAPLLLDENTGMQRVASATWSSANTWSARTPLADKDSNQRLFHGYIESREGSSVTISDIPYGSYDVYVYPMGIEGGDGEFVRSVTLTDAAGNNTTLFGRNFSGTATFIPFIPAAATTLEEAVAAAPATFYRFADQSGDRVTIVHSDEQGWNLGGIAGLSIVDTTPEGTAYPPLVTSWPTDRFVPGGSDLELSVSAVSQNAGGALAYEWRREGQIVGTDATLVLDDVTSAVSGTYEVTVTDSANPSAPRAREVVVIVADEASPVLLSVDMQVGSHAPMQGHAILRENGPVEVDPQNPRNDIGIDSGNTAETVWNAPLAATGATSYTNLVDGRGLPLSGLTLEVGGVTGTEDAPEGGGIDVPLESYSGPLLRDYAFAEGEGEISVTVGGLTAFVGREVTLVVYAVGKTGFTDPTPHDISTVTLAEANNFAGAMPVVTDQEEGRDLRYNNFAFATFVANVAGDGSVSWTIGPVEGESGLSAFNGFQLLISNVGDHVTHTPIDAWRLAYFNTTAETGEAVNAADPDGDGFVNLLEYALGTDPTDAASGREAVALAAVEGTLRLTFAHGADPALRYEIEATDDLAAGWTIIHTYPAFEEAGVETFVDPASAADGERRFLRLRVTLPRE